MHPYLRELDELELPSGDWALFGSGPLLVRGWIDDVGDLDVVARGPAWAKAESVGSMKTVGTGGSQIFAVGRGVTIGNSWGYGEFSIDELIDTAEIINDIPCVRLEHVLAYKRIADRPKDRVHVAVIEEHLS